MHEEAVERLKARRKSESAIAMFLEKHQWDESKAVKMGYKSQLCQYFDKGACHRGELCDYAHGQHDLIEVKSPPQRFEGGAADVSQTRQAGIAPMSATQFPAAPTATGFGGLHFGAVHPAAFQAGPVQPAAAFGMSGVGLFSAGAFTPMSPCIHGGVPLHSAGMQPGFPRPGPGTFPQLPDLDLDDLGPPGTKALCYLHTRGLCQLGEKCPLIHSDTEPVACGNQQTRGN